MSAHNLIIGNMYVDIGDTMTVRKVAYKDGLRRPDNDEQATINFTRRGWFSKEEFKLEGEVTILDPKT